MLAIRPEQEKELKQYALEQYAERTLKQFKRYFPGPTTVIGDDPVRAMILFGVKRAGAHDIVGERSVVLYTSLMLLLGSFFDEDPQYPWAKKVLEDQTILGEEQRAERLYDAGVEYWDRVTGPNSSELIKSLVRARKQVNGGSLEDSPPEIAARLRRSCPPKADAIGEPGLDAVVAAGQRITEQYALTRPRDHSLCSCLAFGIGCRFDQDPMYPWATEVLTSMDIPGGARGDRLYDEAVAFSDRWLTFVRGEEA